MPYDVTAAAGLPPAAVRWDLASARYRLVTVVAVDRTKGVVTF